MMKRVSLIAGFGCLVLLSQASLASSPEVVATPQSCFITGSQSLIDYGHRSRNDLQRGTHSEMLLEARKVFISVNCQFPEKMTLHITGMTAGPGFSWGEGATLSVIAEDAMLDGRPVSLVDRQDKAYGKSGLTLHPGKDFKPVSEGREMSGKELTFTVTMQPVLREDRVRFNQQYDGQSRLVIAVK